MSGKNASCPQNSKTLIGSAAVGVSEGHFANHGLAGFNPNLEGLADNPLNWCLAEVFTCRDTQLCKIDLPRWPEQTRLAAYTCSVHCVCQRVACIIRGHGGQKQTKILDVAGHRPKHGERRPAKSPLLRGDKARTWAKTDNAAKGCRIAQRAPHVGSGAKRDHVSCQRDRRAAG